MNGFTNFLAVNYIWFIIITLILIFALVGYLVDAKEIKSGKVKKHKDTELKIIDFSTVDQSKSLGESVKNAEANSLNLDNHINNQQQVPEPAAENIEAPASPAVEENQTPPADLSVAENTELKLEQEAVSEETTAPEQPVVEEQTPPEETPTLTSGNINNIVNDEDSSSIKVV